MFKKTGSIAALLGLAAATSGKSEGPDMAALSMCANLKLPVGLNTGNFQVGVTENVRADGNK